MGVELFGVQISNALISSLLVKLLLVAPTAFTLMAGVLTRLNGDTMADDSAGNTTMVTPVCECHCN